MTRIFQFRTWVTILVVAGIVGVAQAAVMTVAAAPGNPAPLIDCGPGVPLVKCNAVLFSPSPNAVSLPTVSSYLRPTPAPPTTIPCGVGFFNAAMVEALTTQFGTLQCFRLVGSAKWVVIGDGMSTTAPVEQASAGGSIVAVDQCATGDAACLDPVATRGFAGFTVFYPPNPSSGRSQLQSIEDGRFLMIANGGCGLFTFDTRGLTWYPGDQSIRDALMAGMTDVKALSVPAAVSGATALAGVAPPPTGDCQPVLGQ